MANAKRDGAAPEEVRDLRRAIEGVDRDGHPIVAEVEGFRIVKIA